MISLAELLSACVDVASRAGCEIIRLRNEHLSDLHVQLKTGPKDPVTLCDVAAERLIKGCVSRQFPGITIIGEENAVASAPDSEPPLNVNAASTQCAALPTVPLNEVVLWVDPLDGTLEFVENRLEFVSILLGIAWKGTPVAGVVHQPFIGRTTFGGLGCGVFGCPHDTSIEYPANLECVLTVSFSRTLPELAAISTQLAPCRTVKIGGAGSKGIALLEGKAHVFIAPLSMRLSRWSVLPNRAEARTSGQLQEWRRVEKPAQRDTCAIEALLYASGGTLTDLQGCRYDYGGVEKANTRGVLAATAFGQRFLCRLIPQMPKQSEAPTVSL